LLEVTSLEVPTESAETVAGAHSWRARIPIIFGDTTEKLRAPNAVRVHANETVSKLVVDDLKEPAGV